MIVGKNSVAVVVIDKETKMPVQAYGPYSSEKNAMSCISRIMYRDQTVYCLTVPYGIPLDEATC